MQAMHNMLWSIFASNTRHEGGKEDISQGIYLFMELFEQRYPGYVFQYFESAALAGENLAPTSDSGTVST